MKTFLITIATACGVALVTAMAGKVGEWLWDRFLQEKAHKLIEKFKQNSNEKKFEIIECTAIEGL